LNGLFVSFESSPCSYWLTSLHHGHLINTSLPLPSSLPSPLLVTSRHRTGIGLSNTLGAFLAGLLLAETKYKYQIEADIAPFRGLLLGFFFITVGFNIDLGERRGEESHFTI
jgi:Sodium/hydrogen exchanger family